MKKLETIFYEAKPYLLLALSTYVLAAGDPNPIAISCSLLLIFAAGVILRLRLKNRRGSKLEKLVYEVSPFVYLGLGLYSLYDLRYSKLAIGCALLLLFVGSAILKWRFQNRKT